MLELNIVKHQLINQQFLFPGDVQGRHEDDSEVQILTPPDRRDFLGPPHRAPIARRPSPGYQAPPISTQMLVSADSNGTPKGRMLSIAGSGEQSTNFKPSNSRNRKLSLASGDSPISGVPGRIARDGRRRHSESADQRNRKLSLAGSVSPDPVVHTEKARDGCRKKSELTDLRTVDPRNRKLSLASSVTGNPEKPRDGRRRKSESMA